MVRVILLALAIWAAWWLSGFDARVTGENKPRDLERRITRCGVTAILLGIFFGAGPVGIGFIPYIIIIPTLLGVLWAGCLAELLSRGVRQLVDSDDPREYDPNESTRNHDRMADLLRSGRRAEAVRLYQELKKSGAANILVLETMLVRAGLAPERSRRSPPLVEAHQLRQQRRFYEAEAMLQSLLAKDPANVDAALMLIRLYARDLRRSDQAAEILRRLRAQPHVPPATLQYAALELNEGDKTTPQAADPVLPESVDELLASGYVGTAIEILESKIAEQPRDFDTWLKLAEAHAVPSGDIHRAQKIIGKIEDNPAFTAEQIQQAKAKLAEWRRGARPGKAA